MKMNSAQHFILERQWFKNIHIAHTIYRNFIDMQNRLDSRKRSVELQSYIERAKSLYDEFKTHKPQIEDDLSECIRSTVQCTRKIQSFQSEIKNISFFVGTKLYNIEISVKKRDHTS